MLPSEYANMSISENIKSLANVEPQNIIDYYETNLTDNPGSQKGIFKRGTKYSI